MKCRRVVAKWGGVVTSVVEKGGSRPLTRRSCCEVEVRSESAMGIIVLVPFESCDVSLGCLGRAPDKSFPGFVLGGLLSRELIEQGGRDIGPLNGGNPDLDSIDGDRHLGETVHDGQSIVSGPRGLVSRQEGRLKEVCRQDRKYVVGCAHFRKSQEGRVERLRPQSDPEQASSLLGNRVLVDLQLYNKSLVDMQQKIYTVSILVQGTTFDWYSF